MEKELNEHELRLFDLVEKHDFSDLKEEDQHFVLQVMTEEEYAFQRRILAESDDLMEAGLIPDPLLIPKAKAAGKGIVIPLYQAILAVASVIIVFVVIWPKQEARGKTLLQISKTPPQIQTKFVHDTVVKLKYVPQIKYIEKNADPQIEYITVYKNQTEEPKLLEVAQSLNLPPITKDVIQNKGNSLKEDQSSRYMKPIIFSN